MITIPLNSKGSIPLYEQIYTYIKKEIQTGSLPYQTKLPSTRMLASHLQVSRTTIDLAYGQLLSEGYLESIPKRGYFVSQIGDLANLQLNTDEMISNTNQAEEAYCCDFSPFSVDLSHFPYSTWKRLTKDNLTKHPELFLKGHHQGDESFRIALCSYLHQSRGVHCTKEQIIIGAGVEYLLQLLSLLFPKSTKIAMENPTYKRAYHILSGLGFPPIPIPLDEYGIQTKPLSESDANIVYVTPSHQYPLGITMPIQRRLELLDWSCVKSNRYIIEDDHDSEFRYKKKPIPALQGIDSNQKVIYIGTFSRAIAPAIRVGYMVLPPPLLKKYKKTCCYYSSTVSRIDQSILTDFICLGFFERHLNRMRKQYKLKHDLFLQELKTFGDTIRIHGEHAGLHIVLEIITNQTETFIINLCKKNKIKLYGLQEHYICPIDYTHNPTFLMGYANLSEEEIIEWVHTFYLILTQNHVISLETNFL